MLWLWYQLSALPMDDSQWKSIGSILNPFSIVCNLGFPTAYKRVLPEIKKRQTCSIARDLPSMLAS